MRGGSRRHQPGMKESEVGWLLSSLGAKTSGFPGGSDSKESTCNVGDLGSIPELRRSPEEGNGFPLQHSGLENSIDYTVNGVTKSQTRLSDFHFIH